MINKQTITNFFPKGTTTEMAKASFVTTLPLELALMYLFTFKPESQEGEDACKEVFSRKEFLADSKNIAMFLELAIMHEEDYVEQTYTVVECLMELPETIAMLEKADPRWLLRLYLPSLGMKLEQILSESKNFEYFLKTELSLEEIKDGRLEWGCYDIMQAISMRDDVRQYLSSLAISEAFEFCFKGYTDDGPSIALIPAFLVHPDAKEFLLALDIEEIKTLAVTRSAESAMLWDILKVRPEVQEYLEEIEVWLLGSLFKVG